ncbi:MAG TPA: vanadium-dependent haloperoxidase [Pyrinomonadaceae bacterium]
MSKKTKSSQPLKDEDESTAKPAAPQSPVKEKKKTRALVSNSRRSFIGKAAAATVAASVIGIPKLEVMPAAQVIGCTPGCDIENLTPVGRANVQLAKRVNAAIYDRLKGVPSHPCNNDETLYANQNFIGSYTKGLRKINSFGEVDPVAYCALLKAIKTNSPADFEVIPLGCNPCSPDPTKTDTSTNYDDAFFTKEGTVPDPRPYANSTDSSQLSDADKATLYGGTTQTPSQELAQQQEAEGDKTSGVPNETEARRGITASTPVGSQRRLVNPQGGLAYQLEDVAVTQLAAPQPPTLASKDEAAEIVELYWQSLVRDIPFINWGSDPLIAAAISDLNLRFKPFYAGLPPYEIVPPGVTPRPEPLGFPTQPMTPLGQVPGPNNVITLKTIFRGFTKGDQVGPYLSQFLLHDSPFGSQTISAKIQPAVPVDYMMNPSSWLFVQKGCMPAPIQLQQFTRLISTPRDLTHLVEFDLITQTYLHALGLLIMMPDAQRLDGGGFGIPFDRNNPYRRSCTQEGFVTFGPTHIMSLLNKVAYAAHAHTWHEKWFVHRRLRPEEYAGWVNFDFRGERDYPINAVLATSTVIQKIAAKTGGYYFLPQAYPEGSPVHPAYTAGHATLGGACVTILKAFFNDQALIPSPRQPNASGTDVVAYTESDATQLTVGGELNKLASNIGFGRNHAGVHWRSDFTASMLRGEDVAISLLEDWGFTYNENFPGFEFTDFRGVRRTGIGRRR